MSYLPSPGEVVLVVVVALVSAGTALLVWAVAEHKRWERERRQMSYIPADQADPCALHHHRRWYCAGCLRDHGHRIREHS